MSLIRWEPFGDIERFFDAEWPRLDRRGFGLDLAVDVYEDKGKVVAEMQLPGVDPAKLDVSVEGDYLKVAGSREEEKEDKGKNYYSKEIRRGSFERVVRLPKPVVADKAEASYEKGVLKVSMPVKEAGAKGGIKVKVK